MESVAKARERFAKYPLIFGKCAKEGTVYARCVLLKEGSVNKDDCAKEFKEFNTCLHAAAKSMKTRI